MRSYAITYSYPNPLGWRRESSVGDRENCFLFFFLTPQLMIQQGSLSIQTGKCLVQGEYNSWTNWRFYKLVVSPEQSRNKALRDHMDIAAELQAECSILRMSTTPTRNSKRYVLELGFCCTGQSFKELEVLQNQQLTSSEILCAQTEDIFLRFPMVEPNTDFQTFTLNQAAGR